MLNRVVWDSLKLRRSDLTPLQEIILREASEGARLIGIVNASASDDDAPYWNRKWKYVPEVSAAAVALLRMGLVEVHEPGGALALPVGRAGEVLRNHDNWWQLDDGMSEERDEIERLQAVGFAFLSVPQYWLSDTPSARSLAKR